MPRPTHPYIATDEGWLYLAGVKDLFNGELVGYAQARLGHLSPAAFSQQYHAMQMAA